MVHMTSASKILLARARKYRHNSRTQKMAVVALDIFFVVCRKVSIPTWREPFFSKGLMRGMVVVTLAGFFLVTVIIGQSLGEALEFLN